MKEVTEGMIRDSKGLDYWKLRYERHHVKVPGYGNTKEGKQDDEYRNKIDFLSPYIDFGLKTLDYGCGIGRYAPLFDPKLYVGYDPIDKALEIAKKRNKYHLFTNNLQYDCDQVLFFTVLQHIEQPEKEIHNLKPKRVVLYENVNESEDKNYIWFRSSDYYYNLIWDCFGLECNYSAFNYVHGEKHVLKVFS